MKLQVFLVCLRVGLGREEGQGGGSGVRRVREVGVA
jgi:hypothetical protein